MDGYLRASQDYERWLECPYDKGGALYDEEEDDDDHYDPDAYWSHVDKQMEDAKLGY